MGKAKSHNLPPNPFTGKEPNAVWKELLQNSTSISKEEAFRRMKEAKEIQLREKEGKR